MTATRTNSETNEPFHKRMRDSMEVSLHKYGPIAKAYPHKVDAIKSLEYRLELYKETGNADYLVDIANFAMIEFTLPAHARYNDTPKDGVQPRVWHGGRLKNHDNEGGRIA